MPAKRRACCPSPPRRPSRAGSPKWSVPRPWNGHDRNGVSIPIASPASPLAWRVPRPGRLCSLPTSSWRVPVPRRRARRLQQLGSSSWSDMCTASSCCGRSSPVQTGLFRTRLQTPAPAASLSCCFQPPHPPRCCCFCCCSSPWCPDPRWKQRCTSPPRGWVSCIDAKAPRWNADPSHAHTHTCLRTDPQPILVALDSPPPLPPWKFFPLLRHVRLSTVGYLDDDDDEALRHCFQRWDS